MSGRRTWREAGSGRTVEDLRSIVSPDRIADVNPIVRTLFALRSVLGSVFGLDGTPSQPDRRSFVHELSAEDRSRSLVEPGKMEGPFRVLYVSERESISEVINSTVHAFLVFALVERSGDYRMYWAVYVRPVGSITALYMAVIDPFRRFLVYPAILRYTRETWRRRYGERT